MAEIKSKFKKNPANKFKKILLYRTAGSTFDSLTKLEDLLIQ